jgi:hypothetical protein
MPWFSVAIAEGSHLFPSRTEKLSSPAPMVLPGTPGGRVGRHRNKLHEPPMQVGGSLFPGSGGLTGPMGFPRVTEAPFQAVDTRGEGPRSASGVFREASRDIAQSAP